MIDGFPRAVDQAQYFEQNVMETQQVLFFDLPHDVMLERAKKRAEKNARFDDTEEIFKKRIQNYEDQSKPVIDYYQNIGKVRKIDVTGDVSEIFRKTKEAVLPQTICVIGPK